MLDAVCKDFLLIFNSTNLKLSNSVHCFALWHFYTLLNHTCNICNGSLTSFHSEDIIEAIRLYDRQAFNSDRRYYERVQETGTYLDTVAASTDQAEPKTVQDFLDHIENQELYHVLITVDRLTLQIVLMKI